MNVLDKVMRLETLLLLDKQTHWYVLENDKNNILKDVNISLNKPIFISRNKTKYEEITYNELVDLINKV